MFAKAQGVIYLDRNGLDYFGSTSTSIIKFPYPQGTIQNLDVVDRTQSDTQIGAFIDANKIPPSALIVVLADSVFFEKEFVSEKPPPNPQEEKDAKRTQKVKEIDETNEKLEEIQRFLSTVPLENILAKKYKIANGFKVIATNKDVIDVVREAFDKKGSFVDAVIPHFIFGESVNLTGGLTVQTAQTILQKAELAKQNNLLTDHTLLSTQSQKPDLAHEKKEEKKPKNVRLFILVSIFLALLVVLGLVYFLTSRANSKPVIQQTTVVPSVAPAPTNITSSESGASSPSGALQQTITIQIQHSANTSNQATVLRTQLAKLGFSNIQLQSLGTPTTGRTALVFSGKVPNETRQKIISEVQKAFSNILIQEAAQTVFDVTILLGQ